MKILHIAQNTNGYEEVILIANKVSRNNNFHLIEKDGKEFMTGGFILNSNPKIIKILDEIPRSKQYEFVKSFKIDPFVKFYKEES